ncbi:MAG: 2-oxoglutarate and iron-dependent oxygenase domain-containing protein [Acidimicrobiales bacterium]|nr:2-oxoglutarate and iron-dependent oxygenase domain-containing protein [Acidimicrobiales bacterium]MDG2219391.1 2-oxoglutarate and iron-dependent oxygenase domain-containing protein [Acidimicrobiales bacterium]
MEGLPVLDVAPFLADPSSVEATAFVDALRTACHQVGFAHIVGHGINPALETKLFSESRRFLDLPLATREQLALVNSPAFRGYTRVGEEQTAGGADWRDQLDFGPEQLAPDPNELGPPWLRLRGPNQWPETVPDLGPLALEWLDNMLVLGIQVLRALALALGQPIDTFDSAFIPTHDLHAKIIRYPAGNPATDQGVGLHHDSGLLTFILQGEIPGLEVRIDGDMIPIQPLPGAYVMNLGAMMQAATSGYFSATPHRVTSPRGDQDRLSIALFFNPAFESTFEALNLPPELASQARPEDVDLKGEPIHRLFGENNLKVRLRSHPDVAARHYNDVVAP